MKVKITALIMVLVCAIGAASASAQNNFYEGRTIRFIVGFPAGGGYDLYTRTIARHMGKHIPGYPTMAVENMSGAGSMIAANNVFKVCQT
jgi:tripartite-type tricarboxylate transporter receptor subunit TctC